MRPNVSRALEVLPFPDRHVTEVLHLADMVWDHILRQSGVAVMAFLWTNNKQAISANVLREKIRCQSSVLIGNLSATIAMPTNGSHTIHQGFSYFLGQEMIFVW